MNKISGTSQALAGRTYADIETKTEFKNYFRNGGGLKTFTPPKSWDPYFRRLGHLTSTHSVAIYWHVLGVCDYRRGMDWILNLLTNLYTPLGNTSTYSAIADLCNLHFTVTHDKISQRAVLTSRFLATASNSEDSLASALTSLPAGSQLHRLSAPFTELLTTLNSCPNCPPYNISAWTA
jgi:hypothetical protein